MAVLAIFAVMTSCICDHPIEPCPGKGVQCPSEPDKGVPDASVEDGPQEAPSKPRVKPLSLEGFMDEALPEAPADAVKLKVDNGACYVCHGNYREDELAIAHGMQEISCINCHGDSFDHRNDEDNITPPDKMFARDKVDALCSGCHEEHIAEPALVVKRWLERCPDKKDARDLVCTDCHFDHRLKMRTVRWNKKTGKLLKAE